MDDLKTNPGGFLLSLLSYWWQKCIQLTLFPHDMPSVALHLLVTGSLYELLADFQKPGLVPLSMHRAWHWEPAAVQTSHSL